MASRKGLDARKVSKIRKSLYNKAKNDSAVEVDDDSKVATENPAEAFATFSTSVVLHDGLNVVRSLGGRKYEIISLDAISQNAVGSVEMAEIVRSIPARQAALDIDKKQWDAAMLKCNIAVRITKRDLFRFFALPREMQQTIYELVVFNPNGLRLRTKNLGSYKPFAALSFMLTCRQVYEQTKTIYLQNTFHLDHQSIIKLRGNDFVNNLVDIGFEWEGKWADAAIFRTMATYSNLRILRITFYMGAVFWATHRRRVHNRLFQNDEDLKWFSRIRGFDQLLALRGLVKVTLELVGGFDMDQTDKAPAARTAMENLLNKELTKPKPVPRTQAMKGRALHNEAKEDTDDEDNEESEQEYIPRPTRSRRGKSFEVTSEGN